MEEIKEEEAEEEATEEQSQQLLDSLDILKGAIQESKAKQTPEICILHDLRKGLAVEMHSLKIPIKELSSLAFDTFTKLKQNEPKSGLSMVS